MLKSIFLMSPLFSDILIPSAIVPNRVVNMSDSVNRGHPYFRYQSGTTNDIGKFPQETDTKAYAH